MMILLLCNLKGIASYVNVYTNLVPKFLYTFTLGKGIRSTFPRCIPYRKETRQNQGFNMPRKEEKKIKELKTEVLPPCRVTKSEINLFKEKAKKSGLSLSAYQRQSMIDSVIIERQNILEPKAVSQLSAIGNNLNQLVRKTHIHDETDTQKMRDILNTLDHVIMGLVNGA